MDGVELAQFVFLFATYFLNICALDGPKEMLKTVQQSKLMDRTNASLLTKELIRRLRANNELVLHRIRSYRRMRKTKRRTRTSRHSISSAIVETANCEHVELINCDDYGDKTMQCMLTATGMPCCICNGRLKIRKKRRHHRRKIRQWPNGPPPPRRLSPQQHNSAAGRNC